MYKHVIFLTFLFLGIHCQIRRNVAYTFLQMDKNGNFILESNEIFPNEIEAESMKDKANFPWDKFQQVFPILKSLQWDKDRNYKLSREQFEAMVDEDFLKKQVQMQGFKSFSSMFSDKDQRYQMCQKNGQITPQTFALCMSVWLGFQKDLYQYRLPSFYKTDKSPDSTLSLSNFKKDVMKLDENSGKEQKDKVNEMYRLFERNHDDDTVLDNNQIKIMQPVLLLSVLDRDRNMFLDKTESKFVFSEDYGGDKIFDFADINKDNKISKNQFIAHLVFALDLDDVKGKPQAQKEPKEKQAKQNTGQTQKMEL